MNILVKVKPKAREEKVEKIDDIHYIVHTKEIPEKGRATEGVVRQLSKYFSIPKSKIVIISGQKSRTKTFYIEL